LSQLFHGCGRGRRFEGGKQEKEAVKIHKLHGISSVRATAKGLYISHRA